MVPSFCFFAIISHFSAAAVAFAPNRAYKFVNFFRFFFSFFLFIGILLGNFDAIPLEGE